MKSLARNLSALTLLFTTGHGVADVIYSGLQDITIPTTYAGTDIDVDGVGGWDLNPFLGGVYLSNSAAFQPARDGTGGMDTVLNFATGDTISAAGLNFATGSGGSLDHLGTEFAAGNEGYIGFLLNGTNYGWMRVVFTNNSAGAKVLDWAYEDSGAATQAGNVLQSGSVVTLNSAFGSFTLGSPITGGNSLVKTGANTTTLSGTHSFTGGTTVNVGTLALGHATDTLGDAGSVTVNGGILSIGANSDTVGAVTLTSGSITGSGGTLTASSFDVRDGSVSANLAGSGVVLTKSTAGTVTLSGTNTYTGGTTVTDGVLAVASGASLATTGAVTVGAGATLTGSGSIGGPTTIQGAGTHNAGDSGVGSQAFGGDLTYANSSIFDWDLNANSTASGFDTVSAAGDINVGTGTIFNVIFGGGVDLNDAFWSTPHSTKTWSMTSIFGEAFTSGFFSSATSTANPLTHGTFTINGTNLTWTAIPEPSTALGGLLLTAGLLRRRRQSRDG